jgi:hypothetical protein
MYRWMSWAPLQFQMIKLLESLLIHAFDAKKTIPDIHRGPPVFAASIGFMSVASQCCPKKKWLPIARCVAALAAPRGVCANVLGHGEYPPDQGYERSPAGGWKDRQA